MQFLPCVLPSNQYAFTGCVYFNPGDFEQLQVAGKAREIVKSGVIVKAGNFMLKAEALSEIQQGHFGASSFHREMLQVSKLDKVLIALATINDMNPLSEISVTVDYKLIKRDPAMEVEEDGMVLKLEEEMIHDHVVKCFANRFINHKERFALPIYDGKCILICQVDKITPISVKSQQSFGIIQSSLEVDICCKPQNKKTLKINSNRLEEKQVFKKNMNFQELGIGGLDAEFNEIFRRAFNSRRFPQSVIAKYGYKHVKGMLLYGPPGTGKTLIARKIAEALNCKEPQVVNGPEIFDKYVGGSEEKIRKLFEPAEKDQKEKGDDSDLHVIIFDEIDAICRQRGSTGSSGTGVNESVVNQLLSKMDGVNSLNNILVIGMTNRKDMIDEAVLRPGRLEIHLEIGLPDLKGRLQIF